MAHSTSHETPRGDKDMDAPMVIAESDITKVISIEAVTTVMDGYVLHTSAGDIRFQGFGGELPPGWAKPGVRVLLSIRAPQEDA